MLSSSSKKEKSEEIFKTGKRSKLFKLKKKIKKGFWLKKSDFKILDEQLNKKTKELLN